MKHAARYTLNSDMNSNLNTYGLDPIPTAIFWFMHSYWLQNRRGATAEEVAERLGRPAEQVRKAWRQLERAGLIVIEARMSEAGEAIKTAS